MNDRVSGRRCQTKRRQYHEVDGQLHHAIGGQRCPKDYCLWLAGKTDKVKQMYINNATWIWILQWHIFSFFSRYKTSKQLIMKHEWLWQKPGFHWVVQFSLVQHGTLRNGTLDLACVSAANSTLTWLAVLCWRVVPRTIRALCHFFLQVKNISPA